MLLVSCCLVGQIRVWDAQTGDCLTVIPKPRYVLSVLSHSAVGRSLHSCCSAAGANPSVRNRPSPTVEVGGLTFYYCVLGCEETAVASLTTRKAGIIVQMARMVWTTLLRTVTSSKGCSAPPSLRFSATSQTSRLSLTRTSLSRWRWPSQRRDSVLWAVVRRRPGMTLAAWLVKCTKSTAPPTVWTSLASQPHMDRLASVRGAAVPAPCTAGPRREAAAAAEGAWGMSPLQDLTNHHHFLPGEETWRALSGAWICKGTWLWLAGVMGSWRWGARLSASPGTGWPASSSLRLKKLKDCHVIK